MREMYPVRKRKRETKKEIETAQPIDNSMIILIQYSIIDRGVVKERTTTRREKKSPLNNEFN